MAISLEIERRDPKSKLAVAVKNAGRAQSCVADVTLAQATLEALAQLQAFGKWAPSAHRTAAEHAMLANAVFLYARATATGARAGERGHTPIRAQLNSENQRTHDWIVNVRNTALAHVRANERVSDELWHREIVFAKEQPDGSWLPAAMTRRVQSNRSLETELRDLLPTAERLLKEIYDRRINFVASLLETISGVAELFPSCLLDPVEIFGTTSEAAKALAGQRPGGRSSGVIDR